MDTKPNFTVENEAAISTPPKVDFGKTPGAPSGAAPAPAPAPGTPAPAPKSSAAAGATAAPEPTGTDALKKGY
jgi:LemA protein